MSIQIIEGKIEHIVEYRLNYDFDDDGGYSFPCDEKGNPIETDGNRSNIKFCRENPDRFCRPAYIEKWERDVKNPDKGTCKCGEEFWIENEYMGACQCPKCGQWYNLWGQELLPPDQWED